MQANQIHNPALLDFLQGEDNFGRIAFFEEDRQRTLAAVKVDYDGRFSLLIGKTMYGASEYSRNEQVLADVIFARNSERFEPLAIYDQQSGQIYPQSLDFTRTFFPQEEMFSALQRPDSMAAPLYEAASMRVTNYMNDPANHDALTALASVDPSLSPSSLHDLYVDGVTLAELEARLPVWKLEDVPFYSRGFSDITAAFRYLADPQEAVEALYTSIIHNPDYLRNMGNDLKRHEAEVAAYAAFLEHVEDDPECMTKKAVIDALHKAFGEETVGNLWITAAKGGRFAKYQYPMEQLLREAHSGAACFYLPYIPSVKQRTEVIQELGAPSHSYPYVLRDPELTFSDIADITYRGKSLYAISAAELAKRLETKEVMVGVYKPDPALKEQMFGRLNGGQHPYRESFSMDFKPEQAKADDFHINAAAAVVIGADISMEAAAAQVYQQLTGLSGKYHTAVQVGDAISIDGQTCLVGPYTEFLSVPFRLPVPESHPVVKEEVIGLAAETRDMQSAKDALSEKNVQNSLCHEER